MRLEAIFKSIKSMALEAKQVDYRLSWFRNSSHVKTPRSVMIPEMSFAGVTSN